MYFWFIVLCTVDTHTVSTLFYFYCAPRVWTTTIKILFHVEAHKKKNQRLLNVPCVHHRRWTPCVCLKRDTDQGSGVNLEDPPPHNLCRLLIPTKPRLGIASILSGCPDMWSVNWPLVCSRHLHNTWLLFNCPVYFLFSPFFFGLFLYLAFKKIVLDINIRPNHLFSHM